MLTSPNEFKQKPNSHKTSMRAFHKLKEQKIYFSISRLHSLKTKNMYSPKVLLRENCLRKKRNLPCMLARNEISPPLHHAASNACNKSFSVLSRDIGRTQRTALHRWRRWRLLSSVSTSKVSISIQIQKQTFWKVMGSTYLEGGGGGANFLAPPSCCDQLAEREKLGGAAE